MPTQFQLHEYRFRHGRAIDAERANELCSKLGNSTITKDDLDELIVGSTWFLKRATARAARTFAGDDAMLDDIEGEALLSVCEAAELIKRACALLAKYKTGNINDEELKDLRLLYKAMTWAGKQHDIEWGLLYELPHLIGNLEPAHFFSIIVRFAGRNVKRYLDGRGLTRGSDRRKNEPLPDEVGYMDEPDIDEEIEVLPVDDLDRKILELKLQGKINKKGNWKPLTNREVAEIISCDNREPISPRAVCDRCQRMGERHMLLEDGQKLPKPKRKRESQYA